MEQGQAAIDENAKNEQGGVPEIPYDTEEYEQALLPLISFVAHVGDRTKAGKAYEDRRLHDDYSDTRATRKSLVVLLPLDSSQNAILSFGQIVSGSNWYEGSKDKELSSGFAPVSDARKGNSTPQVSVFLSKDPSRTGSRFSVDWDLDPITVARAVDRTNNLIAPTAKLPTTLTVAVLYDMDQIPFEQNNFAVPHADDLWTGNDRERTYIIPGTEFYDVSLTMKGNGLQEKNYRYVLQRIYKLILSNDADLNPDMGVGCTVFEFRLNLSDN